MQYAILCCHAEEVVCLWSKEHDAAVMERLAAVQEKVARAGKLGPVAPRPKPTMSAASGTGWGAPESPPRGPPGAVNEQGS